MQESPAEEARWRAIRALFDAACTLDASAREQLLQAGTQDEAVLQAVRRLLAAHADGVDAQTLHAWTDAHGSASDTPPPAGLIGGFRIERVLGEGGMGRVYLAHREIGGTLQRVALKIVPFAVQRERAVEQLRRERAILAGLDHPHIARLIEAGELPDNRPYFAMEYVDGTTITRHCDESGLSLQARIVLFLEVCEAVAYAHRRFVLHRDLKPGNILVDRDGRPRLLDFGIAKTLEGAAETPRETTTGGAYFSLRCAAPEQILARPSSVATDVYGLGCLLHEMLGGLLPFSLAGEGHVDLIRRIVHEPPALLSHAVAEAGDASDAAARRRQLGDAAALRAALRGDLERIVARCLRKAPDDRYHSVDALAADLHDVLDHRPISERRSERWYRLRMLLRRHRVTAAVTGVLGVAVLATTALSLVQSQRAAAERDRAVKALQSAQLQRDHAQRVIEFLVNAFQAADPTRRGRGELRAGELLDSAAQSLQEDRALLDPELHATIAQTLAHLFFLLERVPDAIRQAEMAREDMDRLALPSEDLRIRQDLVDAEIAHLQSRFTEAETLSQRGLEQLSRRGDQADTYLTHQLWSLRSRAVMARGDNKAALVVIEQALAAISALPDYRPSSVDWLKHRRIASVSASGDFAGALRLLEALQAEHAARGHVDEYTAIETERLLGQTYLRLGRHAESLPYAERALQRHIFAYGADEPRVVHLISLLAGVYSNNHRNAESMQLYRRAVELGIRHFGEASPFVANQYYNLGRNYYLDFGDLKLGRYYLQRAIAVSPPESRGSNAIMRRQLGEFLLARGDLAEAAPHVQLAHDELVAVYKRSREINSSHINLAYLHLRRYEFDAAEALLTPEVLAEVRQYIATVPNNTMDLRAQTEQLTTFFGY